MAGAIGWSVSQHMARGVLVRFMDVQVVEGRQVIAQHLADDLVRHGGCRRYGNVPAAQHIGMLRRRGGPQRQVSVFISAYRIDKELGRPPQHGQCALPEKRPVPCVNVMLKQVPGQPAIGHGPPAVHGRSLLVKPHRRGMAPQVGIVIDHSAPCVVLLPRHFAAGRAQAVQQVEQRLVDAGQVADFRGPVVHFGVDVGGVVAAPGGLEHVVPDTLQVQRPGAGA